MATRSSSLTPWGGLSTASGALHTHTHRYSREAQRGTGCRHSRVDHSWKAQAAGGAPPAGDRAPTACCHVGATRDRREHSLLSDEGCGQIQGDMESCYRARFRLGQWDVPDAGSGDGSPFQPLSYPHQSACAYLCLPQSMTSRARICFLTG